jgi:hypothetical protein
MAGLIVASLHVATAKSDRLIETGLKPPGRGEDNDAPPPKPVASVRVILVSLVNPSDAPPSVRPQHEAVMQQSGQALHTWRALLHRPEIFGAYLPELTANIALWNVLSRFHRVMNFPLDMPAPPQAVEDVL